MRRIIVMRKWNINIWIVSMVKMVFIFKPDGWFDSDLCPFVECVLRMPKWQIYRLVLHKKLYQGLKVTLSLR